MSIWIPKPSKMNYKIILFFLSIAFLSCETKTKEIEVNSSGGMAYQGESEGKNSLLVRMMMLKLQLIL